MEIIKPQNDEMIFTAKDARSPGKYALHDRRIEDTLMGGGSLTDVDAVRRTRF